ncbi:Rpn family recombination-promoting nuclease/putative transposase [Anaerostipes faecalis]|uniref:Rpn family recombination-promoting nuclease/putative transposase n=1 Tax=Anaerostipes faecalis TaxID=2738446 RepID=UPI001C1DEF60|nr:Rpn family recombination-promoting nuclease/putative transposase [Anaerostipes faecalis]
MKQVDAAMKNLLKDKEKFADLFNGCLFSGKQIIHPENLKEINSEEVFVQRDKEAKGLNQVIKRYRDVFMEYVAGDIHFLLGVESQSEIDYSMPIRVMLYDALSYDGQKRNLEIRVNQKSGKTYRSKMTKSQKIYPIITLVLYHGEQEWEGDKSIYGIMNQMGMEKYNIQKYIYNYKINLIDISKLKNMKNFQGDLQYILSMIKYKYQKEKLQEYIKKKEKELKQLDESSKKALVELLDNEDLILLFRNTEKGEEFDMGNAIAELIMDGKNEGRNEGRIEGRNEGRIEGRNQGKIEGRNQERKVLILKMSKNGMSIEQIAEVTELRKEEIEKLLENGE